MFQSLAQILRNFPLKFKLTLISLFLVMILQSVLELLGIGFFVSLVLVFVLGMEPVSSSIFQISSMLNAVTQTYGIGILFLIASIFFIIRAFIQFLITGIIFWLQYDTERRLVNSSLESSYQSNAN